MGLDVQSILIVDDSNSGSHDLRTLLDPLLDAHTVVAVFAAPEEALNYLRGSLHSLLFVSLDLPNNAAASFVHEARRLGSEEPIILLASHDNPALSAETLVAGGSDLLMRGGLSAQDLAQCINRNLSRRGLDQALRSRLAFDKLITKLSMRFINLPPEELSSQMQGALRLLGEHVKADYSFLAHSLEDGAVRQEFDWHSPAIEAQSSRPLVLHREAFSEVTQALQRSGALLMRAADSSDISSRILDTMRESSVNVLLVVPLLCRGQILGMLGFSSHTTADGWDRDTVHLLRIAGEILANALEQRRVHRELTSSELRYRSVVEGLGEGVLYCDPSDRILQANHRLGELTGYSLDEVLGRTADELFLPPSERHLLRERTARRLQGVAESYEIRLQRKDGSRFWALINATPIYNSQGAIIATLGAMTDVSEQKSATEALRASEEKYRDLVETSSDLIWSIDLDGRITFVNSACQAIYHRSPHEMRGRLFSEFVAPHCRAKDLELFQEILVGKEIFQAETQHCRADGSFVTLAINAIPVRGADRKIIGATGTASDISRRKQVEDELRSQKEFLRQVIDTAPSLILVKDHNFRFTLVNQAFAAGYGKTPDEIIGKTDAEIHPIAAEAREFVEECRQVLATMQPQVLQERPITDGLTGEVRWHYTIRKPLVLPDGRPPQVLTVATDITSRKLAKDEALMLEKQLLQAQKMEAIGQLAAGVAHDLNNALGAVVGHLQLLQLSQDLSPSIANSLEIALGGCERALSLIEQLLGFSRQGKYNLEQHSLRSLVSETVSFLSKVIEKDIKILFHGEENDSVVLVDAAQLQQAVTNLIINAKQAMAQSMAHGGAITFAFTSETIKDPTPFNPKAAPGTFAVLSVSDTGPGIDPAIKDKIFEPFFTTKHASRIAAQGPTGKGTGLGLAMVYGIMQSHGGWVDVVSEPGQGACFRLFLPKVDTGDATVANQNERAKESLGNSSGMVLVVDDEPILVDLTRKFLQIAGISSIGFTEGEQAVQWYRDNFASIDLIVLDMKMAKMDGPACFAALRIINPRAKVAILSGYVQDQAAQELLQKGALKFFQKPLKYPELVRWISTELAMTRPAS